MKKSSPLWKGFLAQLGRHSPSNLNPSESSSSNLNQESIASTSSESVQNNGHRVFLSFRGVDTRKNFVDHLYGHLTRKGISVFKDDISLRKGDSISPQLMQAIGDSHVSVVVFSKDYAASSWCLEEMAFIAHCKQEANQTVFPVFYDVDPSHVRHQSGPYKKPFVKHKWKKPHKVRRWKRAMKVLASSAGWDVRNNKLERLPQLPLDNDTPAGRYFKTVSGSRDHRSGLYLFDCPKMERLVRPCWNGSWLRYDFRFFVRLIKEPNHFRCGFDIVFPWDWLDTSLWFKDYKIFDGCAVMRITGFSEADSWLGFSFCVSFEVKNGPAVSSSSHNPFYLSFESEYTEEYFDMPLNLEVDNIDESKYFWIIYISKEHCHFVKSGAHITFKGHPHVEICGWGIRSIFEQDIDLDDFEKFSKMGKRPHSNPDDLPYLDFDYVKNSNNSFGPKIQLPYNWLVTDEDEAENINAKAKGKGLSYAGL